MSAAWSVNSRFAHDVTVSCGQYVCISRITEPNSSLAWLQGRVQFTVLRTVICGQKLQWLQRARSAASRSTNHWATLAPAALQKQWGQDGGGGRCCEHQEFVLQPWAPPSSLHLLGCVHRRIWISLQGSSEDRTRFLLEETLNAPPLIFFMGTLFPQTTDRLPCHKALLCIPAVSLPMESSSVSWSARVPIFLLQLPFQLPALFPSATVPSVSWSGHAT